HLMPLVEVVKGERTSHEVALAVRDLLVRCGEMVVLVKKDRAGQLGNRLQMALVREAVNIVAEGIADVEDVDLVTRNGCGVRLPAYGIFEHADITGVDLSFAVVDYFARDLYKQPHALPHTARKSRGASWESRAAKVFTIGPKKMPTKSGRAETSLCWRW